MKGNQIMKNRNTIFTTILLACFAFLSPAKAVVPAPDGGYPGFNTAEGQNSLLGLTSGTVQYGGWFLFARQQYRRQLQHRSRSSGPAFQHRRST